MAETQCNVESCVSTQSEAICANTLSDDSQTQYSANV